MMFNIMECVQGIDFLNFIHILLNRIDVFLNLIHVDFDFAQAGRVLVDRHLNKDR